MIEFTEFMNYIILLLEGSKREKNEFIFRFICQKGYNYFNLDNLIDFYGMINREEVFNKFSEIQVESEEEDMAKIVFDMMEIGYNGEVGLDDFENFISMDSKNQNLFNFLSVDADLRIKNIRTKQNFGNVINEIKTLQSDIIFLENIIFPETKKQNNNLCHKKFSLNFHNALQEISKKNKRVNKFLKSPRKNIKNFSEIDLSNELSNSNSFKSIIKEVQNKENLKNPKLTYFNISIIKKTIKTMKNRSKAILQILQKELTYIEQKEKFNQSLKKDLPKQIHDNKHVVFLNNPNWNIVTTMITGISKSINITQDDKYHLLSKYDFKFHNKIEMEAVYGTAFKKCKFKDYAPYVFQNIRKQFGITNESYIQSIGINTFRNAFFDKLYLMLSETSTGKSGSFFFHTSDGKFMIKTIKKNEFEKLMQHLSSYHKFLLKNNNTFLPKFFGLHQIKCIKDGRVVYDIYIVVMNNVFNMDNPNLIKNKYDLKGSRFKRLTKRDEVVKGAAKKDLNFLNEGIVLEFDKGVKEVLMRQFEIDSDFLSRHKIIDYSLLLGIIKKEDDRKSYYVKDNFENKSKNSFCEKYKNSFDENDNFFKRNTHNIKDEENEEFFDGGKIGKILDDNKKLIKIKNNYKNNDFDDEKISLNYFRSKNGKVHYYMGIIDTLTYFGVLKKSEYLSKRIFQDKTISCVPPKEYKERFVNFLDSIIKDK